MATDTPLHLLSDEALAAERDARMAAYREAMSSSWNADVSRVRALADEACNEVARRARGGRPGTVPSKTRYPVGYNTESGLRKHPRVSARFAIDKRLWQGRKVAVVFIGQRGNYKRRTDMRVTYGTLDLTAGRDDQIGVVLPDGQVHIIHVNRVADVYDQTRTIKKA